MYTLFFFLHFLGAILMFIMVGINMACMIWMVFSKETKNMRICSFWTIKMGNFLPLSVIVLLVSSLFMVFNKWDWEVPWIDASLGVLIIITVTSLTIDLPRLKLINRAVNAETAKTPSLELIRKVQDRVLWNSVCIMATEVAAIIHIMIEKFGMAGSLITLAVALLLGLFFARIVLVLANKLNPVITNKKTVNF